LNVDKELAKLGSKDSDERWRTLEELSDQLEYEELPDPVARKILERGLAVALEEKTALVREAALHLVATGATRGLVTLIDLTPLAAALGKLEDYQSIEYALIALGASKEAKHVAAIEKLAKHADPKVREAAAAALEELRGG
jgi:hypothetical protein